jgi:hypothetical protein
MPTSTPATCPDGQRRRSQARQGLGLAGQAPPACALALHPTYASWLNLVEVSLRSSSAARSALKRKVGLRLQGWPPREVLLNEGPMIGPCSCPEPEPTREADKSRRPASPSDGETMATTWAGDGGSPVPALVPEAAQADPRLRSNRQGCSTLRAGKDEVLQLSPPSDGTSRVIVLPMGSPCSSGLSSHATRTCRSVSCIDCHLTLARTPTPR